MRRRAAAPRSLLASLERRGVRLDLAPVRRLLSRLGDPQRGVAAVLVGGTNGKGSTAALLAAIACAAGYRTGLYTSPHLEEPRERLRFGGKAIAAAALEELVAEVVAAAGDEPPTYFEALTVAAWLWFHRQDAELAVLEVGLGGRLDATNACEPLLSLVTSVALDHGEYLGGTLAAVAREKAGIFRRGHAALAWAPEPEVARALAAAAGEIGVALRRVDQESRVVAATPLAGGGQRVSLVARGTRYRLDLPLAGDHQVANLALALAAAEELRQRGFARLDETAVAAGVAGCRWPGRMEEVLLPAGQRLLLDGAHNPAAAHRLAAAVAAREGRVDLLFGVLADKDAVGIWRALAPVAGRVTLCEPSSPRAQPVRALARITGNREATLVPAAAQALERALRQRPRVLLVTGSLVLVGEVRRLARERWGEPTPAADVPSWSPPRPPRRASG
ncbi:MAG TPA: Mur ligase family protein [Thermoanaerobaculia bacterium]|nr:Mur ligase family protein [Thermoanaerobaculia bacterium]